MPAGNDLVSTRSLNSSHASRLQPFHRRPFVAPVEIAQKVAPVGPVQGQQPGRFAYRADHEAGPFGVAGMAGGQPGVGVDHVGRDEGVLEVEHGQLSLGGQHRPAAPLLAAHARSPAGHSGTRCGRQTNPGVGHHRRQIHVVAEMLPVDDGRVEAEVPPVLG